MTALDAAADGAPGSDTHVEEVVEAVTVAVPGPLGGPRRPRRVGRWRPAGRRAAAPVPRRMSASGKPAKLESADQRILGGSN